MKLIGFVLTFLFFITYSALGTEIIVRNSGSRPIYKLYAWPTDLVPRSYSLISSPLYPGQTVSIKIENDWSDCNFTIQSDMNKTEIKRNIMIRRQNKIISRFKEINVCNSGRLYNVESD